MIGSLKDTILKNNQFFFTIINNKFIKQYLNIKVTFIISNGGR